MGCKLSCLESQQIRIRHEVYSVIYLKDVLVFGVLASCAVSWSQMNHPSDTTLSLSDHKLNQAALKYRPQWKMFTAVGHLMEKASENVVCTSAYQITLSVCGIFLGYFKADQTLCSLIILHAALTHITRFNHSVQVCATSVFMLCSSTDRSLVLRHKTEDLNWPSSLKDTTWLWLGIHDLRHHSDLWFFWVCFIFFKHHLVISTQSMQTLQPTWTMDVLRTGHSIGDRSPFIPI